MPTIASGNKVYFHQQVARVIKQRVRTGIYAEGYSLPSVRTLANEFDVSINVIYRAIRNLEENGIVVSHPGKETRVKTRFPCEQTAITFGFIQPFDCTYGFSQAILGYVSNAFEDRNNLAIFSSSKNDPGRERKIATHLVDNGVKGLILWPISNDPNGPFFSELAKTVPVVLVDRLLEGADLPAVVYDYFQCGKDIVEVLFQTHKKRRLLVFVENSRMSSYTDLIQGLRQRGQELGRDLDVRIEFLPIMEIIQKFGRADFSDLDRYAVQVNRIMADEPYDVIFCPQREIIDYMIIEPGIINKYPPVQLVCLSTEDWINHGGRQCNSYDLLRWIYSPSRMITQAGDLVQRWVFSHKVPEGVTRLTLSRRMDEASVKTKEVKGV
jgi:hypothetical protein